MQSETLLLKVSIPLLSHMGSDSPRATAERVMITSRKRETKTVRNEQLEACRVWEEGRRIS